MISSQNSPQYVFICIIEAVFDHTQVFIYLIVRMIDHRCLDNQFGELQSPILSK